MMAALLLAACGHRASNGNSAESDSLTVDSTEAAVFKTDSIGITREDSMACAKVSIDWPTAGEQHLVDAVRRYICEELAASITMEGQPDVILYKTGKEAASDIVSKQYNSLVADRKENMSYGTHEEMQYLYSISIARNEETDRYLTYLTNYEGFLGGAHGMASARGITFSKTDGKRIGYRYVFNRKTMQQEIQEQTLFSKPDAAGLKALIKEGVRSYFKECTVDVSTDSLLQDQLIGVNSVNSIPLPSAPPVFTRQGLCFVYQQYEIAPYAAGIINFDIPYDKVRPYLTPDAAKLIK